MLGRLATDVRATWRLVVRELSLFGVVGLVNLALDIALFNLGVQVLGLGALTSKVIAAAISATSAYFMHRHWTFAHRARTRFRREYLTFFGLNAIGLAIGLIVIAAVRYGLDRTDVVWLNAANLVGVALGTVFRFWSYKRWVFTRRPADREPAPLVRT